MAQSKFIGTGDSNMDAQTIQANKLSATDAVTVNVTGASGPVKQTVTHRLGRKPGGWSVKRGQPGVAEVSGGNWTNSKVDLTFPGNGSWTIELTG